MMRIVLASASPRRRQLLLEAGIDHEVCPASVTEWEAEDADPSELVLHNATIKAAHVAASCSDALVIAADTTVALDGYVLNKPADMYEARQMLRKLSGRQHSVFTAVVFSHRGVHFDEKEVVQSNVSFKVLDEAAISRYFDLVNPLDKAGAYGIQESGEIIVESFSGSLSNIMGLPMETVSAMLEHFRKIKDAR